MLPAGSCSHSKYAMNELEREVNVQWMSITFGINATPAIVLALSALFSAFTVLRVLMPDFEVRVRSMRNEH